MKLLENVYRSSSNFRETIITPDKMSIENDDEAKISRGNFAKLSNIPPPGTRVVDRLSNKESWSCYPPEDLSPSSGWLI
ncbi:hypothetical protein T11_16603 [Trichinella zimbabwensis]|uniref:Uncharacterized protein n=1 Tax=Trichinella zimbabwensis TaxID=268475 RepID=A0A0V1HLX9_9BILA|nr:hypothetical protein T11_16603 [Trichinella zimbabwensis]